jgi:hypothetical protein
MACPTCGEDGEYYRGSTALAEFRHFIARIIWAAHRARQAADHENFRAASKDLSDFVRKLEGHHAAALGVDPDGDTGPNGH